MADETWEKCAREKLSFNDIASVTIYLFADVTFEKKALKAMEKFRDVCSTEHPELRKARIGTLEREIGWDGLYNDEVRRIAEEEFGFKTFVDKYGAYCWIDDFNNKICGDQSGFFSFYSDEKVLREHMKEGKMVV